MITHEAKYAAAARAAQQAKVVVTQRRFDLDDALERFHELNKAALEANYARHLAYQAYCRECEAENLEAHSFDMWTVHGEPEGPLG